MKRHRSHLIQWILTLPAIIILTGCIAATNPSTPAGLHSPVLDELAMTNPLLAEELKKLPEIKDGVSSEDAKALKKLAELYNSDSVAFDNVFAQMYQIGLPDERIYCSPLQALFWIIGDRQKPQNYIQYYSLDNLLGAAWIFPDEDIKMTDQEFNNVINGIIDPDFKDYINGLMEMEIYACVQRYIIEKYSAIKKYNMEPKVFTKEAEKIIKMTKRRETAVKDSKWQDFDRVVMRLNAPELIQFWINRNISYKRDGKHKERPNAQPPKTTFHIKTGDSEDFSIFAAYCLSRNGYESKVVTKIPYSVQRHSVGAYKFEEKYFKIGDTRHPKIEGPYISYNSLAAMMYSTKGRIYIQSTHDAMLHRFN